jgi:hypothetical protein
MKFSNLQSQSQADKPEQNDKSRSESPTQQDSDSSESSTQQDSDSEFSLDCETKSDRRYVPSNLVNLGFMSRWRGQYATKIAHKPTLKQTAKMKKKLRYESKVKSLDSARAEAARVDAEIKHTRNSARVMSASHQSKQTNKK